jgi:putative transposase
MLDRMVEKARQQEIFSREDTPTEKRVLGAFLSHAGLSFRKIEPVVGCCYEAIRDWFHRCKHLFKPDCQARQDVAVDETKIEIDGTEHYVWAAVDCATLDSD